MNRLMCSIVLFGLCGCAEPRRPDIGPASDLDAWRHFFLHQANFSHHGVATRAPAAVEAESLAFESELAAAVDACSLNGFMQDPNALVARHRANVLALPIGYKIDAFVLGRQKRFIQTPTPRDDQEQEDLLLQHIHMFSHAYEFSTVSPETMTMTTSTIIDRHESNCYIYNREFVTDSLGPGYESYPDFLRFLPESF